MLGNSPANDLAQRLVGYRSSLVAILDEILDHTVDRIGNRRLSVPERDASVEEVQPEALAQEMLVLLRPESSLRLLSKDLALDRVVERSYGSQQRLKVSRGGRSLFRLGMKHLRLTLRASQAPSGPACWTRWWTTESKSSDGRSGNPIELAVSLSEWMKVVREEGQRIRASADVNILLRGALIDAAATDAMMELAMRLRG